ncbi:hypothetical protein NIES50_73730 (plasmid) [Aulosira laxa NIES-50]|nr:hypothetical protein [Aulosira sp. FACHB-113]BAZ78740.1 hypothetical protein NIES50_73730 [Aulosira laxa NIES-50]
MINQGLLIVLDRAAPYLGYTYKIDASIRYTVPTPILDVPPSVKHLSSRAETVNNLTGLFSSHTWIAIHGSAGTGKTQLAILVVRACSVTTAWLRLRGLTTEQACVRLDAAWDTLMRSPSQMLVLDDIPRLLGGDEFSERLLLLANSCREKGVHLLSTSCYELPLNLRESLNVQTLYVMEIPLLNNQEASEMLLAYGAPPSLLTTKLVTFINGLAKQHPLLLAATARYLLQQNWQFTEDVLEGLFKSEYTAELNNETISRLLVTIEDTKTRELLYRLNLVQRHFSLDDMQAVASVKPIVERPRERLNTLIGLWVQRDDNNRLLVSPLVQALGSNDLLIETRKECHFLLGERIIRKKQLNQVDGMQALIHFCGAENFNRAGWLLISGLRSLMDLDVLVDDKGLLLLWSDQQLPEQMELTTRLFLRGLQIVVRHKYGMSISYLVEDLDALFRQASEKEAVAVVGVILLVDSLFSQYDPMCMNRYVRSALQLWSEIKMPDTGELLFPDGEPLEILIWTNLKQGIASFDHLRDWIYTLEHLTDGQRRRAFTDGFAELGCLIVSEDLYHKEEAKPRENQQWHIVFDALRELAERASQLEIKLLWVCAVRTQIAVLGTNLNDIDAAVTAAEAVISQSDEPRIQLLIAECMGRQYFNAHRNSEALTWLNKAISQDTTSYPTVRLDALMLASRAVAPEDPDAALKYVQQAAKLAQSNDAISENTLVKTLGELAIARWLARDLAGAFEPWEQAAERLFACKTDTDDWKELFVVFSHVSGYLVSLACRGIPPTNTLDGGPYVAPERGFFFTHRPQMAARYNNSYDSFLTVHLADFAEATGDEEQAAKWALKGIEVARQTNQLTALPVLGTNAIPHLLLDSRYVEVLDFAIETGAILIASKQRFDAGMNALEPNLNVEALLGSKPNELWLRAERDAATMGLLPIVFRLATVAISQPELIQVQAQEVVAACQQVSAIAFDQVLWVTASELIEQIYLQQASFEELINRSNGFTPEHEILWAIGYLVASLQNKATPQSALMTHLYVTHYLYKWLTPSSATYRRIVLPFLLRYWTNTFEKTRFRFSTPRLIESELSEAQSIPETQRAQSILKTIASGLGVGIPSNFEQWLHGHILRA